MDFSLCERIIENISRVIVGKRTAIELLLVAFIADGHALIEDVPGLGKTLMAKSLARTIGGTFTRVQLTPDLLPTDITGFNVYNQQTGHFTYQSGPVITNILLADEINRAPAKVQSALLEAMAERQVTLAKETYKLDQPFLVLATQNPVEQEGTYPLPEAQMDRFLMHILIDYPDDASELEIIRLNRAEAKQKKNSSKKEKTDKLSPEIIFAARTEIDEVTISEEMENDLFR